MAMFPPSVPSVFISWLTSPGDLVYDPFSGRGTTALEACRLGRIGMASDLNPMALVLSTAKTNPPTWASIEARLQEIEATIRVSDIDSEPESIRGIFSEKTLGQLVWLKRQLDLTDETDSFIMATLLGILHLNADSGGRPKGLSVAMPNTFAMAPRYVMKYVDSHDLTPPDVDVLPLLKSRLMRYENALALDSRGCTWAQDAAESGYLEEAGLSPKLIFSSPPYLSVIKYGKFNWIRLWLLGAAPAEVDSALFTTSSLARYLTFMSRVLMRLGSLVKDDGYVCLVIGDVVEGDKTIKLANHVAESCVPDTLRFHEIIADELPAHRKVSRIWGESRGMATKTDRILVLGGARADCPPAVPAMDWLAP